MWGRKFMILIMGILLIVGCASAGMRNGVAQASYELQKAQQTTDTTTQKYRLQRATTVLTAWQRCYGGATREIDDTSFYPVLEEMEGEKSLFRAIKGLISDAFGVSWWERVLAALAPVLGGLGIWQLRRARRHKLEKKILIEEIEKSDNKALKQNIAKRIARSTPFGYEVHHTTDNS